jgi:hypothetical protein
VCGLTKKCCIHFSSNGVDGRVKIEIEDPSEIEGLCETEDPNMINNNVAVQTDEQCKLTF